jgi:hypothetical protein
LAIVGVGCLEQDKAKEKGGDRGRGDGRKYSWSLEESTMIPKEINKVLDLEGTWN